MLKRFENFEFKRTEKPKIDKLYLEIMFEGGDADTEHPVIHEFKNIKFSEYNEHLDEINSVIDNYKILKNILDVNHRDYIGNQGTHGRNRLGKKSEYDIIKELHGEEIARLWDYTPSDPQGDYQFKCYLDSMKLIGYDKDGNKHEAWV